MRKWMKNIILGLMSLLVVFATGGLNIFIHHCSCSNVESISIVTESHNSCCSDHEESYDCCTSTIDMGDNCVDAKNNCCNLIQEFVKIEDNYLVSFSEFSFEIFSSVQLLIPEHTIISDDTDLRNISHYIISVPPLLSGKSLVFFLHQLKLDIAVIS